MTRDGTTPMMHTDWQKAQDRDYQTLQRAYAWLRFFHKHPGRRSSDLVKDIERLADYIVRHDRPLFRYGALFGAAITNIAWVIIYLLGNH